MSQSKLNFCITLLMLSLSTISFGQTEMYKAKLALRGVYEYSYFDKKLIVGKEFHQMEKYRLMHYLQNKVSSSTADYIAESCLNEKRWPIGLRTNKQRVSKRAVLTSYKYNCYIVCNAWSNTAYKILYIPKKKNRHMPLDFRPYKDFFVVAEANKINYADDSITVNFNKRDMEVQPYNLDNLNTLMASIGTTSTWDLDGFYENEWAGEGNNKHYTGHYFAGKSIKEARKMFDKLSTHVLYVASDSWSGRQYFSPAVTNKKNRSVKEYVNPGRFAEFGVTLRFSLINNFWHKGSTNIGYSVRLDVSKYKDPSDPFWSKLSADSNFPDYETFKKQRRSGIFTEEFKLSQPKELRWILFSSDKDRVNHIWPFTTLLNGSLEPYKNIWYTAGITTIGSGNYQFHSMLSPDSVSTGRTLLVYGFKDTEASLKLFAEEVKARKEFEESERLRLDAEQKIRYSSPEEFKEKFLAAEIKIRNMMDEAGYRNLQRYEFEGDGNQKFSVMNGTRLALTAVTFNKNLNLWLSQTDKSKIKKAKMHATSDGMFVHVLETASAGDGSFLAELEIEGSGGDKSQRTILIIGSNNDEAQLIRRNKAKEKADEQKRKEDEQKEEQKVNKAIYDYFGIDEDE